MSRIDLVMVGPGGRRWQLGPAAVELDVIDGFGTAPHVRVVVADGDRRLLADPVVDGVPHVMWQDRRFELAGTAKTGHYVTLTFEDWRVRRLRAQEGERTVSEATKMAAFIRRLARDAKIPAPRVVVKDTDRQYGRGDEETSWDAIVRLAREVQARVWMGPDGLWAGDDRHMSHGKAETMVEEASGPVDRIDFASDTSRSFVDRATVDVRGGDLQPGQPMRIRRIRPLAGRWLVDSVWWQQHRDVQRVELIRPGGGL